MVKPELNAVRKCDPRAGSGSSSVWIIIQSTNGLLCRDPSNETTRTKIRDWYLSYAKNQTRPRRLSMHAYMCIWASQVELVLKQSTCQFRRRKRCGFKSLGQEDPLEEEMATHSSILAWRIPWTEEPGGLQSMGTQRIEKTEGLSTHTCIYVYLYIFSQPGFK